MNKKLKTLGCIFLSIALSGCYKGQSLESLIPDEPPVVSGFPGARPSQTKSAVVWGNDERTVNSAINWLSQRSVSVYGPGKLQETIAKNSVKGNLSPVDEGVVLSAAEQTGVDSVIFADRVGDSRPAAVSVRAVDATTGRVLWGGEARFNSNQLPSNASLSFLTDQALNAAWGVKPVEK